LIPLETLKRLEQEMTSPCSADCSLVTLDECNLMQKFDYVIFRRKAATSCYSLGLDAGPIKYATLVVIFLKLQLPRDAKGEDAASTYFALHGFDFAPKRTPFSMPDGVCKNGRAPRSSNLFIIREEYIEFEQLIHFDFF